MPHRYLIVGVGAAGIAAAETIRVQDPGADIRLISDDDHGYYSRPGLAYYLTGEVSDRMLHPFSSQDFRRLNLHQIQGRATALHPHARQVEMEGGSLLAYDRLLLATGSLSLMPSIPGIELDGVVKLDDMADARSIVQRCRRARAAVVVGGGITALEVAEGLLARRVQTHYFLRRDRYWSNVLDEIESRIVEDRLQQHGIRLHYHTELAEVFGKGGRVSGVRTMDGREIPCNMVAVAIGVRPRIELAAAAGLKADRGILVDEYLQTSTPGIFAAGDVAQAFDPLSGQAVLDTLWSTAVAQGRVAGLNMAGQARPYRKPPPLNITRLAGLPATIIGTVGQGRGRASSGLARGESETWHRASIAAVAQSDGGSNRLRLLVGERALVGAVLLGDQALSPAVHRLVSQGVDISAIRRQLLQPEARLADLILRFWSEGGWRDAAPEP